MAEGTVKWFHVERGYGFISPDDGGIDVYVNQAEIKNLAQSLEPDQRVRFEIMQGERPQACDVWVL
jgi:CspA family cold shock protein